VATEQQQKETSQSLASKRRTPGWRGAFKELQIETSKHHQMQDIGELTPDSMSSRLSPSSATKHLERNMDELLADSMESRIADFAA
jgi:hypothetical protein